MTDDLAISLGVTVVIVIIIIMGFLILPGINPRNETIITVVAGNKTLLSKEIMIGQVTGSEILKDNRTRIQYKLGTWGLGWENHDTIITLTNQTFAPNDNIKIISNKILGKDCKFYFANGTEIKELGIPAFMPTKGDFCGTSYKYEVELLK